MGPLGGHTFLVAGLGQTGISRCDPAQHGNCIRIVLVLQQEAAKLVAGNVGGRVVRPGLFDEFGEGPQPALVGAVFRLTRVAAAVVVEDRGIGLQGVRGGFGPAATGQIGAAQLLSQNRGLIGIAGGQVGVGQHDLSVGHVARSVPCRDQRQAALQSRDDFRQASCFLLVGFLALVHFVGIDLGGDVAFLKAHQLRDVLNPIGHEQDQDARPMFAGFFRELVVRFGEVLVDSLRADEQLSGATTDARRGVGRRLRAGNPRLGLLLQQSGHDVAYALAFRRVDGPAVFAQPLLARGDDLANLSGAVGHLLIPGLQLQQPIGGRAGGGCRGGGGFLGEFGVAANGFLAGVDLFGQPPEPDLRLPGHRFGVVRLRQARQDGLRLGDDGGPPFGVTSVEQGVGSIDEIDCLFELSLQPGLGKVGLLRLLGAGHWIAQLRETVIDLSDGLGELVGRLLEKQTGLG